MSPGRPVPPSSRPEAALSLARLAELIEVVGEDGKALFRQLIDLIRRDAPDRITEIQAAAAASKLNEAYAAAHRLKSGAANLGLTRLQELCQGLEDAARAKDLPGLRELARELEPRFREAASAIEAWYAAKYP